MEQLVSFETAKLLSDRDIALDYEKGYKSDGKLFDADNQIILYRAPTQSAVQRHIRDFLYLHITLEISHSNKWRYRIIALKSHELCCQSAPIFNSFEDALEKGIQQSLNLI